MKKTISILMALAFLAIVLIPSKTNAEAGGALVKITADASLVEVGDTVKVTISQFETNGTDPRATKYVKFKLNYDKDIFQYVEVVGNEKVSATDEPTGTLTVTGTSESEDISSATLSFKAIKATERNGASFRVSEFKSGENDGNSKTGNYNSMQVSVKVREKYDGTIKIGTNKTSVPVERKVNITLSQTEAQNYIGATVSYNKEYFEFVAPTDGGYTADTETEGKVTVKASGTDLTSVTLQFKAIKETPERTPGVFKIESYRTGEDEVNSSRGHLFNAMSVSVAVTPRAQALVQIKTDLTDNTATVGDIFGVIVSQEQATDYVEYELSYNQDIFGYVGLGENDSTVTAIAQDGVLRVTANGTDISAVNLRFEALDVTEGRNEEDEEYIKVDNFRSGDSSDDTDTGLYDIAQVGIKVVAKPVIEEPSVEELPDTGSKITTLLAAISAEIAIAVLVLRKIYE